MLSSAVVVNYEKYAAVEYRPNSRRKKRCVDVETKTDPGMDYTSTLPIEVLEEIFLYLSSDDLIRCSYVSLEWREVINSNKIWADQCSKERIRHKEYLNTSWSLISNPVKVYRELVFDPETTRLTVPCYWRTHYNRYKFLERNWRRGYYTLKRNKIDAEFYSDGILINEENNQLTVYSILNLDYPMYIKKQYPSVDVDAFRVKGNLLFYTQSSHLICMKKTNLTFTNHYEISAPSFSKQFCTVRTPTGPSLIVKLTDKFLVIQYFTSPCFLYFHDYKTGELLRKVKLHAFVGNQCPEYTCLEAFEDKVFVAYSLQHHHILIYDYKTDKVDVKVDTSLKSSELVVSKNFFCSKLTISQLEKNCELHVWSVHTGVEVDLLCTNRQVPVLLTEDDKLIYSEYYTIYVRGLVNSSTDVEFIVEGRLLSMKSIWGNLLVINFGFSLQLWDLATGQKLHTYLRENIQDMWVDDRHIIVRIAARPWMTSAGCIIGFW